MTNGDLDNQAARNCSTNQKSAPGRELRQAIAWLQGGNATQGRQIEGLLGAIRPLHP